VSAAGVRRIISAVTLALLVPAAARAESIADFYQGRTITIVVGFSVGGGYDLYARLLAQHLGDHIPGHPAITVQNMPGAGSLKAVNYLYSVAAPDGSIIGTFARGMGIEPMLGRGADYDGRKLSWLGSITKDVSVCVASAGSPIKAWKDIFERDYVVGGEGGGSDQDMFALLIKNVFGARVKLVTGFPGTSETVLAMERGELDGLCGLSYSTIKSRYPDWRAQNKAVIVVQSALAKEKDLPDVPLLMDLAKTSEQVQILKLLLASQFMSRPFAGPPAMPEDRKDALRKAFAAAMIDPSFLAEAQKIDADVNPVDGAAIDALLGELYATPKDVVAKAAHAIKP
jgi:tripartite-type tricarboxylate transporter receptor subunit TctC